MEKARLVFDEMSEPDLVSWNALIPGYYLQGFYDEDDTEELQEWDQQPALLPERTAEVTSSVYSVMGLLCLAESQGVIIRKSEEKGNTQSLLTKLHYGDVQMLDAR
ncbi:hypothetical protein AgCh_037144 [Apium graveolens]